MKAKHAAEKHRGKGVREGGKGGVMECRSNGAVECWGDGVMEQWSIGAAGRFCAMDYAGGHVPKGQQDSALGFNQAMVEHALKEGLDLDLVFR